MIANAQNSDSTFVLPSDGFTNSTIDLTKENSPKAASSVWEYILSGFNNSDPIIQFCYWFSFICLLLFIGISLFLIFNRYVVAYFKNRKSKIYHEIQELLTEIIYADESEGERKQEIIHRLNKIRYTSNFYSNLLRSELLELHKQFKGESADVLRGIYIQLKFHVSAMNALHSESWTRRSSAIRELSQMDIEEAAQHIRKSLNHINPTLRLEAGIALLKLDKKNPYALLDTDKELTEWQQVCLLNAIITGKDIEIPMFSKWLSSKQTSIQIFSLRMIEYYHQLGAEFDIIQLLKSNQTNLQLNAIKTLGSLESFEAIPDLMELYKQSESTDIKQAIIESIAKIGAQDSLDFLIKSLHNKNRDVALTAAYAIKSIGAKGKQLLLETKNISMPGSLEYSVITHCLDEYLSIR